MGLFGFGKKKEDKAPEEAQSTPAAEPTAGDGVEMKLCEMCKEKKPASEGKMMMEGTAFRCNDCALKSEGDDHGEVCEFC